MSDYLSVFGDSCDSNTEQEPPTQEDIANQRVARSPRPPETPAKLNPARDGNIEDLSPLSSQEDMTRGLIPANRKRSYKPEPEVHKKRKFDGECSDGKTRKNEENVNESYVSKSAKTNGDKQIFDSPKQENGFDDQQTVATTSSQHFGSNTLTHEIADHIIEQVTATVASYFEVLQTEMNNNIEEKMHQWFEYIRKVDKSKKRIIKKLFKK